MTVRMAARPRSDRDAAVRFLDAAYAPDDWLALVAKSHTSSAAMQRVRPRRWFQTVRVQAWLRALNAQRWSLYVSVNAIIPGRHSRRREAIAAIRHVFVDIDHDGPRVLRRIADHADLPRPSYIVHSSPGRAHVLWRVRGFDCTQVEALQRHLSRELETDPAATPCSQTTRLPGFWNHKRPQPALVVVDYLDARATYGPTDFPVPACVVQCDDAARSTRVVPQLWAIAATGKARARRYLAAIEPAIAGQHGDRHTFRTCCRLVRGFALSDPDALDLLVEWNARCQPPWTLRELAAKLRHARRYGREPIGGLLESASPFS